MSHQLKDIHFNGRSCVCYVLRMTLFSSRWTDKACALLAFVSTILGLVLLNTTSHEVCETLAGQRCLKDVVHCSEDNQCYCPNNEGEPGSGLCVAAERKWDSEIAHVVASISAILFLVSAAALVVSCICCRGERAHCSNNSSTAGRGEFDEGGGDCGSGDGGERV